MFRYIYIWSFKKLIQEKNIMYWIENVNRCHPVILAKNVLEALFLFITLQTWLQ